MSEQYNVASFFSGCGGFDLGFEKAGYNIVLASDIWEHAANTYKMNFPHTEFLLKDIRKLSKEELQQALKKANVSKIDIVIGGPPCQCFTRLNNEYLLKKKQDDRKELFRQYINKIKVLQPKLVFMENVRDLLVRKDEKGRLYKDLIVKAFKRIGYVCYYSVINIEKYDVPQKRQRVIFVASNDEKVIKKLEDEKNRFPNEHKHTPTVKEYLDKITKEENLENHIVTENTPFVLERIKHIPPGGYYEHLPDHLKTKKVRNGRSVIVKRYGSYYRRLHPNMPAKTLTNNYLIHPTEDRYITNREMAVIHTFPPKFKFFGGTESVSQQIANAVPPNFSRILASHALRLLE